MKDYSTAYKAYDIRSVYDEPVDGTFCYSLGRGIGQHLFSTVGPDASFVFAADVREANNELIYRFLRGLEDGGCDNYVGIGVPVEAVDDEQQQLRGVASTMMLYYCAKDTFDMGAVFTASHNTAEYVGIKIVNKEALLVDSAVLQGLVTDYIPVADDIDEIDFERVWRQAMGETNSLYPLVEDKIQSLSKILGDRFSTLDKKYTFVVDFSNGSAVGYERIFLEEIVALSGHQVIFLNELADSEFEAHASDTTDPHDYTQLIDKVREVKADFGIMFDGDADRLGLVDEQGSMVSGDLVAGIIALNMLTRGESEQKKVIHDVFFTKAILEAIQAAGGTPIKSRVGHRFVKELFKSEQALFAGELSAHLFFNEVGGFECPLLALYYIMDSLQTADSLSALVAPYQTYYKPSLRKYELADASEKEITLHRIQDAYRNYTVDLTDGVGVYADDFWFVIRASNTEPVLKMVMEADTQDIWEKQILILEEVIAG